jgi:hypothetical protein
VTPAPALKYGKRPARPGAVSLRFRSFFSPPELPPPPRVFGKTELVPQWDMLANDIASCCVFSGAAHESMLWAAEASTLAAFSDAAVLADYAAVTGYDPDNPDTDQGTDLQQAASYRRKTGVIDITGKRHTIDAYAALRPGDISELALATYILGAAGVGLTMPASAQDQFTNGEPWAPVAGEEGGDGHYVPCVGRNSHGHFLVVTWGRLHAVTPAFLQRYMDEGLAYISFEQLHHNVSPRGFDEEGLRNALATLTRKDAA